MKNEMTDRYTVAKLLSALALVFITTLGNAQDKGLDIKVDVDHGNWYANPIVWIIGAAVFILLLVALLRGGEKK